MKRLLLLPLAALLFSGQQPEKPDTRPNIIIILADDMGFSDIGAYGGEIHTPNLDQLAAGGLRFSGAYNTSRCCPTRASLLTGLYNHNAGIGRMSSDEQAPGYRGFLTGNTVTIAEVLKEAGYHTAMAGKWHVSNTSEQKDHKEQMKWLDHQASHPWFSPEEQYPLNRGFEKFYGTLWGVVDYFDPFSLVNGTTPVTDLPAGYYHTDAINDTAAAYVRQLSGQGKPFFLYVAENAPHWPLQALPEDIEKYRDTYKVGWDSIRERRYRRLVQMGMVDPARAPLSPRWKDDLKWENNPDSVWDARAMAVHAAMIDRMDRGIGHIIQALRETGQLDNTLILFLSDNGASPEDCAAYGPGFDRPDETRAGKKIIYPTKKEVLPGPETSYASIGPRWANVANTPYRYAKADSYEGGIHTPLIAWWPGGIQRRGTIEGGTAHVMDLMATCIELAHAHYPREWKGHAVTPLQGISLAPVFRGKIRQQHSLLFNEHFGAKYVRNGDWKLVARSNEGWRLYKISEDQTELHDLAGQYPDKVKEMDSLWRSWSEKNQVVPRPGK